MILKVEHARKYFPIRKGVFLQVAGYVKALEEASFEITEGETVGIVGESGCGKTTLGRVIVRIYEPTSGRIQYTDRNGAVHTIEKRTARTVMKRFRRDVQMVFQDPYNSLDPRMTIGDILKEPLDVHFPNLSEKAKTQKVGDLLLRVGLYPEYMNRYPHEFSGGQRQRISIARSIASEPRLVICDEPTSALDVSVQSQIVNLLKDIQQQQHNAFLFISHNLDLIHHLSDRILVMYLGNVVEEGNATKVFDHPQHPYTQMLMGAIPDWDPENRKLPDFKLQGEPPSPINPPKGCPFHTRCPHVMEICSREKPRMIACGDQHQTACHLLSTHR